jgi:hypothetical protein
LPNVVWINFYVDTLYATSTSGSTGSFNWNSASVADGYHDITAIGFEASGTVSGYSNIHLLIANSSPSSAPGAVPISGYADRYIGWVNLYVDSSYAQSAGGGFWNMSQSFTGGTHQVQVSGSQGNHVLLAAAQVGSLNFGSGGSSTPSSSQPWAVTPGATISGLTGSAANISGADTNPSDYGHYWEWGDGYPLIGGPLLNDTQAASFVVATQQSVVETSSTWGLGNAAANNYFNSIASGNPSNYLNQLEASDGFYAGYAGATWQAEADRVDGACPLANPTTAEVLQWAANKWGINPILMYAEVTEESSWNQMGIGDNGNSSGLLQVADRGYNHAFPGFGGSGSMLARENSCFNADFFAAWIYSAFNGLQTGTSGGDVGTAIQSWYSGQATSAGAYTAGVYGMLSNLQWVSWWFNDVSVPY